MTLAHRLNKRVTLQHRVIARDAAGQPAEAWVNVIAAGDGKIWAGIRDLTGRQFVAAGGTQNEVQTEIEIRHRPGVTAAMRVLHGDDIYDIKEILDQKGRALLLMSSKGINRG